MEQDDDGASVSAVGATSRKSISPEVEPNPEIFAPAPEAISTPPEPDRLTAPVPAAPAASTSSVPEETATPPVKVLAELSATAPGPLTTSEPAVAWAD